MPVPEMATVLRAALPLVQVPRQHAGGCLKLCVLEEDEAPGAEGEVVWAEVEEDGSMHSCPDPTDGSDAWGRGQVKAWIPAIMDGEAKEGAGR